MVRKKKCNHVLLKFQPTNLSILSSSYSKKRLNGPFTIWRSSGRKVAHDNLALKGKQPPPRRRGDPKARLKFGSLYIASIWRLQVFLFMKPNNFKKKRHQIKHQINQNQRIFETFDLCSFPTKSCRLFRKSPQKIVGGVFLPEDPLN